MLGGLAWWEESALSPGESYQSRTSQASGWTRFGRVVWLMNIAPRNFVGGLPWFKGRKLGKRNTLHGSSAALRFDSPEKRAERRAKYCPPDPREVENVEGTRRSGAPFA